MSKPSDLAHQNLEDVVVNHQYSDVEHLDLGDLVTIHDQSNNISSKKKVLVDTIGNITYSLIVGTCLDYNAGLNLEGIAASRFSATILNTITGGAYGWWREQAYKITKTKIGSGIIKKKLVDLIAFNTFQVPVYVIGVVIGGFISEPNIDWKKVQDGATSLALISPILGPTMGWYLDFFRKCFGIKPAYGGDSTKRDITRVDY